MKNYEYKIIRVMQKGIALKCCACNAKLSVLFKDNIKTENVWKDESKTKNYKLSEEVTEEAMRNISSYEKFVHKCGNFSCAGCSHTCLGHKRKQTIRRDFRQKVRLWWSPKFEYRCPKLKLGSFESPCSI